MIKYILTWVIGNSIIIPCPNQPPLKDQFGRINPKAIMVCDVLHTKIVYDTLHYQTFNRDSAIKMFKLAEKEELLNVTLDSIKIK